jgi:hypothetical protein
MSLRANSGATEEVLLGLSQAAVIISASKAVQMKALGLPAILFKESALSIPQEFPCNDGRGFVYYAIDL